MPTENPHESQSALIIKPSSFGDVIHALPVARAIKKAAPHITVDWLVSESLTDLVRMSRYVDNHIPFKRSRWTKWWRPEILAEIVTQIRHTRRKEYDFVIDLQGLIRSGLMTLACRGKVKAGFANAREGAWLFYGEKISTPPGVVHAVDRYMEALGVMGLPKGSGVGYGLVESEAETAWAASQAPAAPFAVVNPNARWITKRWPLERFGLLCRELEKRFGYSIVIIGGPEDAANGARLAQMAGDKALDLTGKTSVPRLAALLRRAEVLFTNDSGPLHLAVAVGAPSVSIFGPTDPAKTGPYGQENLVLRSGRDCSPCFNRACSYNHECMTDIEVSTVVEAWATESAREGKARGRITI
ncbi:MAG: glycosyltransferase family 9 protein [Nitrospinota bacterium]|nr:glycosyltransferase family 9 protein [Nitrospinota bacterium]MDH5679572.1 glycosyltransferase family 9 protein [Nitrospinota bacterium]